jgi:transcriptional regulator with XRE-family HTH domain
MQRFGEKLRTLRERQSMTQWNLADRLGISQSYVYKLETGQKKPNIDMLMKIADLFGVSLDQLARDDLEVDGEP